MKLTGRMIGVLIAVLYVGCTASPETPPGSEMPPGSQMPPGSPSANPIGPSGNAAGQPGETESTPITSNPMAGGGGNLTPTAPVGPDAGTAAPAPAPNTNPTNNPDPATNDPVPPVGTAGTAAVQPTIDAGIADGGNVVVQPPADGTDEPPPLDPNVTSSVDPVIPEVTADCPNFVTGAFNFQGLSGLMSAGPKQAGTGALVFYWHGTVMSASAVNMDIGAYIPEITNAGGIVVAPNGPPTGEGGDMMCSGTAIFGGSFRVVDQIVACAVRDHTINPHRIYATGCSAGGLQSGCMAARRSRYTAAVAPNSGGQTFPMPFEDPARIPSVMTMHGGPADVVGVSFTTTSRTLDDLTKNAGGFVINCNHGGMHCGAGAALYGSAMQFLHDHPFGVDPEPYAGGLPAGFHASCQIF